MEIFQKVFCFGIRNKKKKTLVIKNVKDLINYNVEKYCFKFYKIM